MSTFKRFYRLFSAFILLSLLLTPVQPLRAAVTLEEGKQVDKETSRQGGQPPAEAGLYRTTVTVDSPARRARLEGLGVVVLARHGGNGDTDTSPGMGASAASEAESVSVLADADQLESLARLGFQPRGSDDVDALVAAHAQDKPGLAAAWAEWRQRIETDKRMATAAASPSAYLLASVASLTSLDDDADGLTNTEEAWWCIDLSPQGDDGAQRHPGGQCGIARQEGLTGVDLVSNVC